MTDLGTVEAAGLVEWLRAIDFVAWPRQQLADGRVRPAMVTDPAWHGFGAASDALVAACLAHFPGRIEQHRLLSIVLPGQVIDSHTDPWACRVHVPLRTNPWAVLTVEGRDYHLEAGRAYVLDGTRPHGVRNLGPTSRVHFVLDVV
jgi:hypothetical protein